MKPVVIVLAVLVALLILTGLFFRGRRDPGSHRDKTRGSNPGVSTCRGRGSAWALAPVCLI